MKNNINEKAIEELTKILIKEHKDKTKYIVTKEDIIRICIKVIKTIEIYK